MATRLSAGARIALAAAVFVIAAVPPASRARAQGGDAAAELAESQRRQAELAAEVDLLRADDAEVGRALDTVNAELDAQIGRASAAAVAADEARAAVETARSTEASVADEVAAMERQARDLALALYLRPPSEAAAQLLAGENLSDSPRQVALVRFRAEDAVVVARQLRVLRNTLTEATLAAELAQTDADEAARTEYQRLEALREAKDRQEALANGVGDRIDHAIGEAEILKGRNDALAARIQSDQAALATKLRDAPQVPADLADRPVPPSGGAVDADPDRPGRPSATTSPSVTQRPGTPPEPQPTQPRPPEPQPTQPQPTRPPVTTPPTSPPETAPPTPQPEAPPTTAPPPVPPAPPSGGSSGQTCSSLGLVVDTAWAGDIEVNVSVAGQVESMVVAAAAEGVQLIGNGYRNCETQVQIRREVCGTSDYDIWERPSWECSPPVARPGRSMHEKGLAIDFFDPRTNDLIRSHDTPEWQWLSRNAGRFGFINLPVEPWHWSTTGG